MRDNIIFLISQPRSGSTFLQFRLSKNTQLSTTGEPWFLLPVFKEDFELRLTNEKQPYNKKLCTNATEEFINSIENFPDIKKKIELDFYCEICNSVLKKENANKFIDKTPRYYYIIDELIKSFPKSHIIILYRNPMAVLNSILNTWIHKDYPLILNHKDDLLLAPNILAGYKNNDKLIKVNYEDIIKNPKIELMKLCELLKIDFEESMIKDFSQKKQKYKFGDPVNVYSKNKFSVSLTNNWKNNINAQKWRFFNDYLNLLGKETIDKLGYSYNEIKEVLDNSKPSTYSHIFTFSLNFFFSKFSIFILFPLTTLKRRFRNKFFK